MGAGFDQHLLDAGLVPETPPREVELIVVMPVDLSLITVNIDVVMD